MEINGLTYLGESEQIQLQNSGSKQLRAYSIASMNNAARVGDRVTCKGLTRAAVENATRPCYRARKRTSTITIEAANDAPCQLRGRVAGVSRSRGCFWLQGGAHVCVAVKIERETTHTRFALPLMGQVIELYGGEVTMAGNYFAGATASMRADGQELLPVNMDKMRGGASEADYRALETIARRELGDERSRRILTGLVTQRGLKRGKQRSAHDELLAAFFPSRRDDEKEPLKASLLEDLRPGRVDVLHALDQIGVVRLHRQRETAVGLGVFMGAINHRIIR